MSKMLKARGFVFGGWSSIMATVDDRLVKLERHIRGMDQEINTLSAVAAAMQNKEQTDQDESSGSANPDHIWVCRKCGARLGFYDPVEDILRVRYKDFVTYIHIGTGGFVKVLCRSCSEMNKATWEEANSQEINVREGA